MLKAPGQFAVKRLMLLLWALLPVPALPQAEIAAFFNLREIIPSGGPPGDMTAEIRATRDTVFALYNALNDEDEFDIHCYPGEVTGTPATPRMCRANFVNEAFTAMAASTYLRRYSYFMAGDFHDASFQGLLSKPPALRPLTLADIQDELDLKTAILQTRLFEIINAHQALQAEVVKLQSLMREYQQVDQD